MLIAQRRVLALSTLIGTILLAACGGVAARTGTEDRHRHVRGLRSGTRIVGRRASRRRSSR